MNLLPQSWLTWLDRSGTRVVTEPVVTPTDETSLTPEQRAVAGFASIVWPEPVYTLEALVADMLTDEQVVMALELIASYMSQADVTIQLVDPKAESKDKQESASESDDDTTGGNTDDDADELDPADTPADARLDAVTKELQQLWDESFATMLDIHNGILTWGRCLFLKSEENNTDLGITKFSKLEYLPATVHCTRATSMRLTNRGEFDGVDVSAGGQTVHLPPESVWWCAIGESILEPYGRSLLAGAPAKVRESRRKMAILTETYLRRWAIRPPVIHAPTSTTIKGVAKNNHDIVAAVLKKSQEYGNPLIFDNARDANGNFLTDIDQPADTLDPEPITALGSSLADDMCLAFGIHPRIGNDNASTGSYASVSVYEAALRTKCDKLVRGIFPSFQKYVAEKMVARNWPEGSRPKVVISCPSLLTEGFIANLAFKLVSDKDWSPVVASGAVNIAALLKLSGIPLADDFEDRLEEAIEIAKQQKQQMPPSGSAVDEVDDPNVDPLFGETDEFDEPNAMTLAGLFDDDETDDDESGRLRILAQKKRERNRRRA